VDGGEIQSWGPLAFHPDVDLSGDDIIQFLNSTGGVNMTIDNGGNVGIGTPNPRHPLHVTGDYYGHGHVWLFANEGDGNSGTAYVQARDDSGTSTIDLRLRAQDGGTVRDVMALKHDGTVGIGTTTPSTMLEIHQGSTSGLRLAADNRNPDAIRIRNLANSYGEEVSMWQEDNGDFLITNDLSQASWAYLTDGGTWAIWSDVRVKDDVQPLTGMLDKALALRPVSYYLKNQNHAKHPDRYLGFIAQEVEPVLPTLVTGRGDERRALDYTTMSVVAIGAVQELYGIVQSQKAEIDALRNQNAQLPTQPAPAAASAATPDAQTMAANAATPDAQTVAASQAAEIAALRAENAQLAVRLARIEALLSEPEAAPADAGN
jgi:hypothetical protein